VSIRIVLTECHAPATVACTTRFVVLSTVEIPGIAFASIDAFSPAVISATVAVPSET
jgi:hypothetical protein